MATPQQEQEARALLAKGDQLGSAASTQTGVAYAPQYTSYQPQPIPVAQTQQAAPQPMNVPAYTPPPPPNPESATQSVQSLIDQYNAPSSEETAAQEKEQGILSNVEALINKQGTQAARTGELEAAQGIPGLKKNLNDINAQINAINSSAFKATQDSEGRLAPTFAIYGEQAQIERQKSAQTFGLAAAASALQGNIALANDNVKRAIDSEFGGIESQLQYQQLLLNMNKDKLTSAQKKKADVLQLQLQSRQEQLETAKQEKGAIYNVMTAAAQNGADSNVLNRILSAPTKEAALQIAAQAGFSQSAASLPASAEEYKFAVDNGYKGTFEQYQNEDANRKAKVAGAGVVTAGAPNSYKEWELAGKPGTYADWLKESNVKAPTVAQQTVATYAARLEQSNPIIGNLESSIVGMNPLSFEAQKKLPSYLQSSNFQQYDQASRNFINAVLRRESGAVISPSEFDNAYKQYLPKPGDSAQTLAQKKANRDVVYQSLRNAAGNAYQSVDDLIGSGSSGGGSNNPLGI